MKHKVIVAMSLVAAGVMTYLMFSRLDEGFYHFLLLYYTDNHKPTIYKKKPAISRFQASFLLLFPINNKSIWLDG